jgi:hypothetical protein
MNNLLLDIKDIIPTLKLISQIMYSNVKKGGKMGIKKDCKGEIYGQIITHG